MAHGGARERSGPKTTTPRPRGRPVGSKTRPKSQQEGNDTFDRKALEVLPQLFELCYEIARGYKIAVYAKPRNTPSEEMYDANNESVYVYSVPPDKAATFYLVDRAAGKAASKNPEVVDTELTLEIMMPGMDDAEDETANE